MRYRKIVVSAIAVIALAGTAAVPAVAAQLAQRKLVSKTAQVSSRESPVESAFIKQVGSAVIRNQEQLLQFKGWMVALPGFKSSGYVWGIDDLQHRTMTLLWHGPRTPLLAKVIREGARRGIRVIVHPFAHSQQQLNAAMDAIWQQVAQGKWAGFKVSMVMDINVSAPDSGLTVQGTYTSIPAARRAPQVRSLFTTVMGMPVHVQPGRQWVPAVSRTSDLAPFNAGGFMWSYYGHFWCSSGFAVIVGGRTYTTTARHCQSPDFVDSSDASLPNPPPTDQWYGSVITVSPTDAGGAALLGNYGSPLMFNHGPSSTTSSTVTEQVDPDGGTLVCDDGGNSGEHCNIKIYGTGSYYDGYGTVPLDLGHQQNGTIADITGDSGGPVMTITGSSLVNAAGMIQTSSLELPPSQCGPVNSGTPGKCGAYVGFEPFGNVLSSFKAAGYPATIDAA